MFCSNCGSPNEDGAKFCQKCGQPLAADTQHAAPAPPTAPAAPSDTRMRDTQAAPSSGRTVTGKNPVLATVLSIIPGVGQFYNGDNKKGAVMLGLAIVLGIVSAAFPVLPFAVLVWSMIDAYRVASGQGKTW